MGFLEYSNISFRAFVFGNKQQEVVNRKHAIVKAVYDHHNLTPKSVLFLGFNPAILQCTAAKVYVADLSTEAEEWLRSNDVAFEAISSDDLFNYGKEFDAVVALEEYFTFAETEAQQKSKFDMICNTVSQVMITTLRDYKNQEFKDREFSTPAVIKSDEGTRILVEFHDYDTLDRNAWTRTVFEITGEDLVKSSGFSCRHMFFKQCAKFGYDAGAREFLVHKNLMYKSLLKKNYEHVISIKFG